MVFNEAIIPCLSEKGTSTKTHSKRLVIEVEPQTSHVQNESSFLDDEPSHECSPPLSGDDDPNNDDHDDDSQV